MDEHIEELKEEEKAGVDRGRQGGQWLIGLFLIAVGLFFLLSRLVPIPFLNNWWALFILIPAGYNLNRAWRSYRRHGRLTSAGRGSLVGGLLIGAVGLIFLFGLNWAVVWPVFIIIVGVGILLGALLG